MSSCPTAPTSTTASSPSCPSPAEPLFIIACGALGAHLREIIARRGWPAEVHTLPALLHNRPNTITDQAERLARAALARGQRVAVAYADCGTYGALDGLCTRLGLRRLPGLHCYDVFAGPDRMRAVFEAEPGSPNWGSTGTRSCGRTTSGTTAGWSGWPRTGNRRWRRRPAGSRPGSACRSPSSRQGQAGWN